MNTYRKCKPMPYSTVHVDNLKTLLNAAKNEGYTHVGKTNCLHECTAQLYQVNGDQLMSASAIAYRTPMNYLIVNINPYRSKRTTLPKSAKPLEATK